VGGLLTSRKISCPQLMPSSPAESARTPPDGRYQAYRRVLPATPLVESRKIPQRRPLEAPRIARRSDRTDQQVCPPTCGVSESRPSSQRLHRNSTFSALAHDSGTARGVSTNYPFRKRL